jgi:uncharacterized protein (DUF302 family)
MTGTTDPPPPCGCRHRVASDRLWIDPGDCPGNGALGRRPNCRAAATRALEGRSVDVVVVAGRSVARIYAGGQVALLVAAGRFAAAVERGPATGDGTPDLARRVRRRPVEVAARVTSRGGSLARIAAESALSLVAAHVRERYRTRPGELCSPTDHYLSLPLYWTPMTLPIDPERLTEEDIGEKRATLEMDHEAAVEHVREVFTDAGFGVPVEFSLSDILNEKVDADRGPYYVLGACNPEVADRALDSCYELGGIMPCNVIVWEEAPGVQTVYHVSIMRIARLLGMAPDDEEWADVVATTGGLVDEAYGNL